MRNDRRPFSGGDGEGTGPLGSESAKAHSVRGSGGLFFRARLLGGPLVAHARVPANVSKKQD